MGFWELGNRPSLFAFNPVHTQTFGDLMKNGVGDITSQEKGSGARYNDGKPDYSLIPMHLLADTARVFTYGAKKYAAWNWSKGMAWSIPFACLLRHAFAWFRGQKLDPESGLPHTAHMVCNILMLIHYENFYPEGDDRPKQYFAETSLGESK